MPATIKRKKKILWKCNRGGQWLFLASPHWQVLGDGDRGGGKTDALLMSYLKHVGRGYGPDWRGIIFRRTYPQLRDLIARSNRWIPTFFPGAKFNKTEREWVFPTGEVLIFSYINSLSDYEHYHGHAYPYIGFEELTSWPTSECFESMLSCSRTDVRIRCRSGESRTERYERLSAAVGSSFGSNR